MGGDNAAKLAPALPNIMGKGGVVINYETNGCFKDGNGSVVIGTGTNVTTKELLMDASLSSQIYGNADTVQPPTIQLLPQIRF